MWLLSGLVFSAAHKSSLESAELAHSCAPGSAAATRGAALAQPSTKALSAWCRPSKHARNWTKSFWDCPASFEPYGQSSQGSVTFACASTLFRRQISNLSWLQSMSTSLPSTFSPGVGQKLVPLEKSLTGLAIGEKSRLTMSFSPPVSSV